MHACMHACVGNGPVYWKITPALTVGCYMWWKFSLFQFTCTHSICRLQVCRMLTNKVELSLVERLHVSTCVQISDLYVGETPRREQPRAFWQSCCVCMCASCHHVTEPLGCRTVFVLTRGNSTQPHYAHTVNKDEPWCRRRRVAVLLKREADAVGNSRLKMLPTSASNVHGCLCSQIRSWGSATSQ